MGYLTLTNLGAVAGYFGITILTAAAAAYALFRWLGSQWIDNKFSQQLEAFKGKQRQALEEYKAGHQKALEQLKLNINTTFDRTVKLHVREFDALYEIWEKLNAAFNVALAFISPIRSSPDFWRMDADELDRFFAKQDLSDDEREAIEKAKDKVEEYRRIVFFKEYREAHEKFREFDMALNVKGIFIDDGLAATFKEIADEMWGVMSKHRLSFMREVRGHAIDEKHFEEVDNFHSMGRAKLDAVGVKVKASLRAANHV